MKLGIIGLGNVGSALRNGIKTDVLIYDEGKKLGSFENVLNADAIFICLPTPFSGKEQDADALDKTLDRLSGYKGIVIIKSTVLYHNISRHLNKLRIVMNPEFLSQHNNYGDFLNQSVIILGCDNIEDGIKVRDIYKEHFTFKQPVAYEMMSVKEAIDVKYVHNIYHAYKALFWNFVYEITNGNHRKMASVYKKIVPEGNEMDKICSDGKLGYGGSCFPKDVKSHNSRFPHPLTDFMIKYNDRLR